MMLGTARQLSQDKEPLMLQDDPRILELRAIRERARQGGGVDRIARQRAKGRRTARERYFYLATRPAG